MGLRIDPTSALARSVLRGVAVVSEGRGSKSFVECGIARSGVTNCGVADVGGVSCNEEFVDCGVANCSVTDCGVAGC